MRNEISRKERLAMALDPARLALPAGIDLDPWQRDVMSFRASRIVQHFRKPCDVCNASDRDAVESSGSPLTGHMAR